VVLNGTSSSGKSSIAVELQRQAPELQFLHLQLDVFRAMEPPGYWADEYRDQASLRFEALCRAMNKAAAQFAACGQNVFIDHVLTSKALAYMLEDLIDHRVLFVGVKCSEEELCRREHSRGNRPLGLAQSQLASVHAHCLYDIEVDTSCTSAASTALSLAQWLRESPEATAHPRMQHARSAASLEL
jgi:chloramphenicol 3-O phosphotransferase